MKPFIKYILSALVLSFPLSVRALESLTWVSLYSGAEKGFNTQDRSRVVSVLSGFGIDYYLSNEGEIMVSARTRMQVLDLVAAAMPLTRPQNTQ